MTDPTQSLVLAGLAGMIGARTIVEAGTYKGASAQVLGELNPDARVWTADVVDHGADLPPNTRFYCGDFLEMLNAVQGPIDFAYIDASGQDADGRNVHTRLRWTHALAVLPMLSPGGIIAWDDTLTEWDGVAEIRAFANMNIHALKGLSLYQKPR